LAGQDGEATARAGGVQAVVAAGRIGTARRQRRQGRFLRLVFSPKIQHPSSHFMIKQKRKRNKRKHEPSFSVKQKGTKRKHESIAPSTGGIEIDFL